MFILSQLPGGSCIPAVPVLNLCFFPLFCFPSCCSPPPWCSTCSPSRECWGDGGALPGAVFTSQASSRALSLSPLKISTTNPTRRVKAVNAEAELKANDMKDGKASSWLGIKGRSRTAPLGHTVPTGRPPSRRQRLGGTAQCHQGRSRRLARQGHEGQDPASHLRLFLACLPVPGGGGKREDDGEDADTGLPEGFGR